MDFRTTPEGASTSIAAAGAVAYVGTADGLIQAYRLFGGSAPFLQVRVANNAPVEQLQALPSSGLLLRLAGRVHGPPLRGRQRHSRALAACLREHSCHEPVACAGLCAVRLSAARLAGVCRPHPRPTGGGQKRLVGARVRTAAVELALERLFGVPLRELEAMRRADTAPGDRDTAAVATLRTLLASLEDVKALMLQVTGDVAAARKAYNDKAGSPSGGPGAPPESTGAAGAGRSPGGALPRPADGVDTGAGGTTGYHALINTLRIPMDRISIATHVARTGETVNVADAYDDLRFNQARRNKQKKQK